MVATAGKTLPPGIGSSRTQIHDFLPGDQLCRLAQLVICNGGSPTTNQALAHGVPVLGIARNMDQFLNMRAIEEFGAGLLVRADRVERIKLGEALQRLLQEDRFAEQAGVLANSTSLDKRQVAGEMACFMKLA
jgi:UDP:flavonoid glycosyltransferase YjiC (YdhE family)